MSCADRVRWLALVLLAASIVVAPQAARAESPTFELDSLTGATSTAFEPGMVEFSARIDNPTAQTLSGNVVFSTNDFGDTVATTTTPFSVAPGSNVLLRIPVVGRQAIRGDVVIGGRQFATTRFSSSLDSAVRVFDANPPSRLKVMLENVAVPISAAAASRGPGPGPGSGAVLPRLRFATPVFDTTTGAPILPFKAASWHGTHLVVMPSNLLVGLRSEEVEALAGFVLAGGTLAINVTRPEDTRSELLRRLVGGPIVIQAAPPVFFTGLRWPTAGGRTDAAAIDDSSPSPSEFGFVGYSGGNLNANELGASAPYGLGEIVLLGFDPTDLAQVTHPWVRLRAAELARRAFLRTTVGVANPGEMPANRYGYGHGRGGMNDAIRRILDPNQTARWGIGLAAIFICAYAVLAGPVAFARAKRKNKPLRALLTLPLFSLGAFLVIVVLGLITKGAGQSAYRLTFVDAGAGVSSGVMRRYRSFFSTNSQDINVGLSEPSGMLSLSMDDETPFELMLDSAGLRLTGMQSMPGQTVVVREDGLLPIGEGVTIAPADGHILITNRTGATMRGLIIKLPGGSFRYHAALAPGATLATGSMTRGEPRFLAWATSTPTSPLGAPYGQVNWYELKAVLTEAGEPELGDAWLALSASVPEATQWFPSEVPVVLALLDDVDATERDSGVPVRTSRTLLRVVGFGGQP